jgi:hypothetical protein
MNHQSTESIFTRSDGGGLDRLLEGSGGRPPAYVRVDNDLLYYGFRDDKGQQVSRERVPHRRGLLAQFVKLADAPVSDIVAYARRWGVLYICAEHGHPGAIWHRRKGGGICRPLRCGKETYDPIARWRDCARYIRTFLNVAAAVHIGELGRREDWDVLFSKDTGLIVCPIGTPRWHNFNIRDARIRLSWIVDRWLEMVMVVPYLDWTELEHPTVKLRGQELPGALAIELLFITAGTDGLAICTACGTPYVPHRRPRAGERTYCRDCGRQAAVRDAARAYRVRKKQRAKAR